LQCFLHESNQDYNKVATDEPAEETSGVLTIGIVPSRDVISLLSSPLSSTKRPLHPQGGGGDDDDDAADTAAPASKKGKPPLDACEVQCIYQ